MKIYTNQKKSKRALFPLTLVTVLLMASCGGNQQTTESSSTESATSESTSSSSTASVNTHEHSDSKGVGKFTSVDVSSFKEELALKGKSVFEAKCSACHKIDDQKVVGPGLKGVTQRRTPEWIMNMITNPEEMTKKDPVAMALLSEHLTQMTFQNVSDDETREILEYLRQNDGAK